MSTESVMRDHGQTEKNTEQKSYLMSFVHGSEISNYMIIKVIDLDDRHLTPQIRYAWNIPH